MGEDLANRYVYNIADRGAVQPEYRTVVTDEEARSGYWTRIITNTIGSQGEVQPRIYNAMVSAFENKMRQAIREREFQARGYGDEISKGKPLTDEQVRNLQQAKITLVIRDQEMPIWIQGGQVPRQAVPAPDFFQGLSENEKNIIEEAIKDRSITKEKLLDKLKLSEYSDAADRYFRTAASTEDAEYVAQKFAEKTPQLEAEARAIEEEKTLKQGELESATRLLGLVKDYNKVQKDIPSVSDRVANLEDYLSRLQAAYEKLNTSLSGLPRKSRLLGGGVKDKEAEALINKQLAENTAEIERVSNEKIQETQKLEALQKDALKLQTNIKNIDVKAFNEKSELTISQWDAQSRVEKSQRGLQEFDARVLRLDKTRELWSQGKFMDFSMTEMRFVLPDSQGEREVDTLADRICSSISNLYGVYSHWEQLPETAWEIGKDKLVLVDIKTDQKRKLDYDFKDLPQEFRSAYGPNLARVLSEAVRGKLVEKLKLRPQQAPKITITVE